MEDLNNIDTHFLEMIWLTPMSELWKSFSFESREVPFKPQRVLTYKQVILKHVLLSFKVLELT